MMSRNAFFVFGILCVLAASARAQTPEVDQAEVLRRGDLVQHVDGYRADPNDAVAQAMRPPESDADKWFISIITTRGCSSCEKLKEDWKTSRHLQALAVPDTPKKSWAHWNVYSANDKSQANRFENLKVAGYPTIVVQPPRTGEYGSPSTVVFQETGYDGNDRKLAQAMVRAIRAYVAKLDERPQRSVQEQNRVPEPEAVGAAADYGVAPPWDPDTDDSFLPAVDGKRPLRIPPIDTDDQQRELLGGVFRLLWQALLKLFLSTLAFIGIVAGIILLVLYIRKLRQEAGKKPIVSDDQLAQLLDLLRKDDAPATDTKSSP